ncbi:MAG TPA: choice-of-anchor X domain-containing protein [Thermoanaerobaculia bacterium]|nr:choice-of-anchor X domain-containing protein [Thermoanaerobaculia bacterium]
MHQGWIGKRRTCRAALAVACVLGGASPVLAQDDKAVADVVIIVDTSVSMKEPGMDPERTSLLVAKMFADIVPGDLAVVRMLDLEADKQLLPGRDTGRIEPCTENPSQQCHVIAPASDWLADARKERFGVLARPARGESAYKTQLDSHLAQVSNNSAFELSFAAAQGVFDQHGKREVPRMVVWLSDGRADHPDPVRQVIATMKTAGTAVEAVVFGRGDVTLARESGLEARQVSSPAQLMKAFAGAFRRIVQAPYEIDNEVAVAPSFDMRPDVREAWIVVYGNDSLGEVSLSGPQGTVKADYARDAHPGAGAYRVAYLERPAAGRWTVQAQGGGAGVAFAVVQRSALSPMLLAPQTAAAGTKVQLVAALTSGTAGTLVTDPGVLGQTRMSVFVENRWIDLADDGANGDATRGDGRFSGWAEFQTVGDARVRVRAVNPLLDRTVEAVVKVAGIFESGAPVEIDLGTIKAGGESCQPLRLAAVRHQGAVPFELHALRDPAFGHALEVRLPAGVLRPGDKPRPIAPGDPLQVCLRTSARAPSSTAAGEPWLELRLAGTSDPRHAATLKLRWQVSGLTFWQRWGWLILTLLGVLLALFVILGFVLPKRFQSSLAVTFVPDRRELDEQTPQPVAQWKGVGIGFYRNARAFLHSNYRLSGNPRGALAGLFAEGAGTRVAPGRGSSLFRETLDGDWETVEPVGRRARGGDVYRSGDGGPFFRISFRAGRG